MAGGLKIPGGFAARFGAATLVVFATYNPSGYSYVDWLLATRGEHLVLKLTLGLALAMIYYALLSITLGAMRLAGVMAGALASVLLVTEIIRWVAPASLYQSWSGYLLLGEWVLLLSFALVLAFGMSWSALIERLTGQQQKRYVAGPPTTPPPLLR